jgi:hypothetical protein
VLHAVAEAAQGVADHGRAVVWAVEAVVAAGVSLVDEFLCVSGAAHVVSLLLDLDDSPGLEEESGDVKDVVDPAECVSLGQFYGRGGVSCLQALLLRFLHLGVQFACGERHGVLYLLHSPARLFGAARV